MAEHAKVIIHGAEGLRSDFEKAVKACRWRPWRREHWWRRDTLVPRTCPVRPYSGQGYDPTYFKVEHGTWSHDHCLICGWELCESDDEEQSVGYVDGADWICSECYHQFVESR